MKRKDVSSITTFVILSAVGLILISSTQSYACYEPPHCPTCYSWEYCGTDYVCHDKCDKMAPKNCYYCSEGQYHKAPNPYPQPNCYVCNSTTGWWDTKCTNCQDCINGKCKDKDFGQCNKCVDGEPVDKCTSCQDCINGKCKDKDFGQCNKCVDGEPVDKCTSCQDCVNGKCKDKDFGPCTKCVNGEPVSKCTSCQDCVNGKCKAKVCPPCSSCVDGNCVSYCPEGTICNKKNKCVPDGPNTPDYNSPCKGTGGDPVALNTGEFQFTARDFVIPGRVFPIEIVRTYRSQGDFYSPYGYGWDLNYNFEIIKHPETNTLLLRSGQCSALEYSFDETTGRYVSPNEYYNYIIEYEDETCILFEKNGEKLLFDSDGKLTEIQDRTGSNSMYFTYDSEKRIDTITNDLGNEVDFDYYNDRWTITDFNNRTWTYRFSTGSPDGNDLHSVTDPNGQVTTYNYSSHNLTSIVDATNQTWLTNTYSGDKVQTQRYGNQGDEFHFTYYPASNMTTVSDRRGVNTETVYNSAGLPLSKKTYTFTQKLRQTDPDYYLTRYEYDTGMNMTRRINPGGNCVKYTYDDYGNIITTTMEPNNGGADPNISANFTYNTTYNFVETITDAIGNTTTYAYNAGNGNLESITYPEVNIINSNGTLVKTHPVVEIGYNSYGQIETVTTPDNIVTKYEYYDYDPCDPMSGRLKTVIVDSVTGGLNITTGYEYDVLGNIVEVNDPNKNITQVAYNVLGKITRITDSRQNNTSFSYDKNRLVSQMERDIAGPNQITQYAYSILDNLKTITDPCGYITEYAYDQSENLSSIMDAQGRAASPQYKTSYDYDERNLLWKITDANSGITQLGYTLNGDLNDISDAKGNKTGYEYDRYDRLVKITYPDGNTEQFGYDASSNVTSYTNRSNQTIVYKYDALNRLIEKQIQGGPSTYFVYDIAGRVVEVNDYLSSGSGITRYKYDRIGRVSEVNDIFGKTVKYEYDNRGLRTKLTYPDDSCVTYEYDSLARVKNIKYNGTVVAAYSYDELGRRTQVNYGNGTKINYQYDIANHLLRIANDINGTDSNVLDFNYPSYDKVGNRLSMKNGNAKTQVYSYDKLYQLTAVDYNNGSTASYSYDKLGNRNEPTAYSTNALNQYYKVSDMNYSYDRNGNLTSDGVGCTYCSHYEYSYDVENRLTGIIFVAWWPWMYIDYQYDYQGRRVRREASSLWAGGYDVTTIYDGDQIIADCDGENGNMLRKYVYGPGIDEPICLINVADNNAIYYYHYNGLGSVVALSSSGLHTCSAITGGTLHSLALTTDGKVAGWGSDDWGQIDTPGDSNFVAVSAGWINSFALKADGNIVGWGSDDGDQLYSIPESNDFVAISAGADHCMALKRNGSVVCWGDNTFGQCNAPESSDFNAISAGTEHSIALKQNGSIACWGDNTYGQTNPPSGNNYVAIAAGCYHSLALRSDGTVVGWGRNDYNQVTCPGGNDFNAVAAGWFHSIGLKKNGTIVCWGYDGYDQATPPEGNDFVAISAGAFHSMALRRNGTVVCWGNNESSQAAVPQTKIVERYSYDVYGNTTIYDVNGDVAPGGDFGILPDTVTGNRFMFTGREYSEFGLYYYRARYYSPRIGRFLQTDPVGYDGGLNLYAYCLNNPLNWLDPWGLDTLGIHSSFGHSFITYTDDEGVTTSYGLWDDSAAGNNCRLRPGTDVRKNHNSDRVNVGRGYYSNRYYNDLTPEQKTRFIKWLKKNHHYHMPLGIPTNNCSSWASDTYKYVTGERLRASDWRWNKGEFPRMGIGTPEQLKNSIIDAEKRDPTTNESEKKGCKANR